MYDKFTTYFNVRALADGAFLGRVGQVTIITTGKAPKSAILDHVKSLGWDCNGVAYDETYEWEVLDNLRSRKAGAEDRGWPLSNYHLKLLMGLPPKLPNKATGFQKIGNVQVCLLDPEEAKNISPGRARPHRIFAVCPRCTKMTPAGRLSQHMKVHAND